LTKLTELANLRTLVAGATLTAEAKHSALWCLDQLPGLYAELHRSDESRYWDAIGKMCQAVLKRMGQDAAGEDAGRVSEAVVRRLGKLHQRLAIAPLVLKITAAPAGVHKKKAGLAR
jgi:hypothetical protein